VSADYVDAKELEALLLPLGGPTDADKEFMQ
jgi:hypothetical protein